MPSVGQYSNSITLSSIASRMKWSLVGFECLIKYIVLDLSVRTCLECRKLVAYKLEEKYEG